jgi:hypothetical protein
VRRGGEEKGFGGMKERCVRAHGRLQDGGKRLRFKWAASLRQSGDNSIERYRLAIGIDYVLLYCMGETAGKLRVRPC